MATMPCWIWRVRAAFDFKEDFRTGLDQVSRELVKIGIPMQVVMTWDIACTVALSIKNYYGDGDRPDVRPMDGLIAAYIDSAVVIGGRCLLVDTLIPIGILIWLLQTADVLPAQAYSWFRGRSRFLESLLEGVSPDAVIYAVGDQETVLSSVCLQDVLTAACSEEELRRVLRH